MKRSAPVLIYFSFLAGVNLLAEPGKIVLFNGTSSAGKSSLAEVVVRDSKTKYEVVSFDDFHRSYREKHGIARFNREQYEDFRVSLYRYAKAQSEAGRNIIIDTVEFDLAYDRYCETSPAEFIQYEVTANNITAVASRQNTLTAFNGQIEFISGKLYCTTIRNDFSVVNNAGFGFANYTSGRQNTST